MDRVCHFEIPYDDKERMEKFYSDVFGWQFMSPPGDFPYTFAITAEMNEQFQIKEAGGINGGTYKRSDGTASNSPVIVIEVESCTQRIGDIESAGGKVIVPSTEIPNMGIYAQVEDPEGNIIGLWQTLRRDNDCDS